MAKQTVSTKPVKVYGYINKEALKDVANNMDYGVENPVGKKDTIIKVIGAAKEFDISTKDVVQCTMGNTEGYIINQNGLYRNISNNIIYGVLEADKYLYIPVVVEYKQGE